MKAVKIEREQVFGRVTLTHTIFTIGDQSHFFPNHVLQLVFIVFRRILNTVLVLGDDPQWYDLDCIEEKVDIRRGHVERWAAQGEDGPVDTTLLNSTRLTRVKGDP